MATRTISPAGGKWSETTAWVEGAVPTNEDDVVATGSSGNLTIAAGAVCRSINLTGYTKTLTHEAFSLVVNLPSNPPENKALVFPAAGWTYTKTSAASKIEFQGGPLASVNTFDFGGKTISALTVQMGNTNAAVQALSAFTVSGTLTLTKGILDTNGKAVSCGAFSSTNTNTRELKPGASTVTIVNGGAAVWNTETITGLTVAINTATIVFTGAEAQMRPGGVNLNGASVEATGTGQFQISLGNLTANNFVRKNAAAVSLRGDEGKVLTLTGNLEISGTAGNLVTVGSSSSTVAWTVKKASGVVSLDYVKFKNFKAEGTPNFFAGTHSTNEGNTAGWRFEAQGWTPGNSTSKSAALIDNFNGTGETSLREVNPTVWGPTGINTPTSGLVRKNEHLYRSIAGNVNGRETPTSGVDHFRYITISSLMATSEGYVFMAARIQKTYAEIANEWNGYGFIFIRTAAATFIHQIRRYTKGVSTVIKTSNPVVLAVGDKIGYSVKGSVLTQWRCPSGSEVWEELGTIEDATYPAAGNAGNVGIEMTAGEYDDWSGADITATGSHQVTVEQGAEADSAIAPGRKKISAAPTSTEADVAIVPVRTKRQALSPATEVDGTQSLRATKRITLTPVGETSSAIARAVSKKVQLPTIAEADTAMTPTRRKTRTASPLSELEGPVAPSRTKHRTLVPAAEADTVVAPHVIHRLTLIPVGEFEATIALGRVHKISLVPLGEVDEAVAGVLHRRLPRVVRPARMVLARVTASVTLEDLELARAVLEGRAPAAALEAHAAAAILEAHQPGGALEGHSSQVVLEPNESEVVLDG